jgi:hypothetical protein
MDGLNEPTLGEPRDIFISHAGEDEKVVQSLAKGLEREGFTTWYYERDNTFLETTLSKQRERSIAPKWSWCSHRLIRFARTR